MSALPLHEPTLSQLKTLNRTMHRIRALLRLCAAALIGLMGALFAGAFSGIVTAFVVWLALVLLAWNRNELSQPD